MAEPWNVECTRNGFSATDLNELQRQLSAWRGAQRGRSRLPEQLWTAAATVAKTDGVSCPRPGAKAMAVMPHVVIVGLAPFQWCTPSSTQVILAPTVRTPNSNRHH